MRMRPVQTYLSSVSCETRADGSTLLQSNAALECYPKRMTERLEHWAVHAPKRTFLARRSGAGWKTVSYGEAREAARRIGQALLDRRLCAQAPVLIVSGNGIEHGLLALACLQVGVPFIPVSVSYSLASKDFSKLRDIVALVRPGLVFAEDGRRFEPAIKACIPRDCEVWVVHNKPNPAAMFFDDLLATVSTPSVDVATQAIGQDSVAKLLFTSGSTGTPKGVTVTHGMLSSMQKMLEMAFPFVKETPPVMVDWLPWSHVLGGSCNFGLAMQNGGTLYIDDGKPLQGLIEETVRNLREIAPTIYWSVPKGYEELLPWLQQDDDLRKNFFSRVNVLHYAGASIAQNICDAVDRVALGAVGERIQWSTMLGSTEAGAISFYQHSDDSSAGNIGLPLPGVTLKLVPTDGRVEARVRGPCVTPGYWQRDDLTAATFDAEKFLLTGDALAWIDRANPHRGLRYDGRVTEDFKLSTGTWVRVGNLRTYLLRHLAPLVRDLVIAGENRNYIAVLALPSAPGIPSDAEAMAELQRRLSFLAQSTNRSSQRVLRFAFLSGDLSVDAGDVTDKGSLSQRNILRHHWDLVERLYADKPATDIISFDAEC